MSYGVCEWELDAVELVCVGFLVMFYGVIIFSFFLILGRFLVRVEGVGSV